MSKKKKFIYQRYNYDGIVEKKYNVDKWYDWVWGKHIAFTFEKTLASEIVPVHALDMPTGQIYYMDFKN